MIPSNASTLRITAAAGTELASASFMGTVKFRPTLTGLYNPKAFIAHTALLRQTFVHCAKFPTAASRRSLGRVPVPVWLIILSDQLRVVGLVSHYLTNNLMRRGLIHRWPKPFSNSSAEVLDECGISSSFELLSPAEG